MLKKVFLNLTLYPLLIGWTTVAIILALPLAFTIKIFTFWKFDRTIRYLIWLYGKGCLKIVSLFVRIKVEISEKSDIKPPCVLVANHLSFFDVYLMAALPFSNIVFVVKNWPFKIWFYAPFMRLAGYLNVERYSLDDIVCRAQEILSSNAAILFFPEGHRSRDGRLGRFYSGAFKIAFELGVPVVPVCIRGTDVFLAPGQFLFNYSEIVIKIGQPVEVKQFESHLSLKRYVKQLFNIGLKGG